ncbi:MAG: phosphotransferase [Lachnospiraceae bacterium]|nr:phosphotransferase [Lachnospiraceae bacterium]
MQINKLMEVLDLGEVIEMPREVQGGLLHKMYRVTTTKGTFAVKVLNQEIMKRPSALNNTINSEKIAAIFQSIVPAVASCKIQDKQIHEMDGRHYMIFPWVEGRSVFPPEISKKHCEIIGDLLGKMHRLNIALDEVKAEDDGGQMYEWERYLQMTKEQEAHAESWLLRYENSMKDIAAWNGAACEAQDVLTGHMVISHRDLDPKNVIWNRNTPFIIDWEAAGYVNPYQELLEVINYWVDDGKGSLNLEYLEALTEAYGRHVSLRDVAWEKVLAGSYAGMLGWLAYNVRRALGIEASDDEEIRLGKEQVTGTIQALYDYQAKAELLLNYFKAAETLTK